MEYFDFDAANLQDQTDSLSALDNFDFSFLFNDASGYSQSECPEPVLEQHELPWTPSRTGFAHTKELNDHSMTGCEDEGALSCSSYELCAAVPQLMSRDSDVINRVEFESSSVPQPRSRPDTPSPGNTTGSKKSESTSKRSSSKFTKDIVHILKTWLRENAADPYPTDEEKDMLRTRTGLRRDQISNWFVNARRSKKARRQRAATEEGPSGPIDIELQTGTEYRDLNPMDR